MQRLYGIWIPVGACCRDVACNVSTGDGLRLVRVVETLHATSLRVYGFRLVRVVETLHATSLRGIWITIGARCRDVACNVSTGYGFRLVRVVETLHATSLRVSGFRLVRVVETLHATSLRDMDYGWCAL